MYFSFVMIVALVTGSIIGAIPAVCGAIKGKIGLAIGGFFACVIGHFLLGLILSIPICALFLYLIFRNKEIKEDIKDNY